MYCNISRPRCKLFFALYRRCKCLLIEDQQLEESSLRKKQNMNENFLSDFYKKPLNFSGAGKSVIFPKCSGYFYDSESCKPQVERVDDSLDNPCSDEGGGILRVGLEFCSYEDLSTTIKNLNFVMLQAKFTNYTGSKKTSPKMP